MSKKNVMDMIPVRNKKISWFYDKEERIVLVLEHKGIFDRLARFLAYTPEKTRITLDSYGTFLWAAMDGTTSVYELGLKLEETFGTQVHPLHERLLSYLRILRDRNFIFINRANLKKSA